jgi:LysR family transcriptional regulator, regulator for bpeEF and oprC
MHDLEEIRVFLLVAKHRSFTAAATEANITLSAVSKRISRLEQRLGVQLLTRTTRSVGLTEAGAMFNEKCRRVFTLLDEAQSDLHDLGARPRGRLRINAPESFGRKCIAPILPEFLETYPDINVELSVNSRMRKFEEGFDVFIRRAELKDDRLAYDVIYIDRYIVCTSQAYLDAAKAPLDEPRHLVKHNCIIYKFPQIRNTWDFHFNGRIQSVQVGGNLICNDYDNVLQAAIRGLGVACIPSYVAQDAVNDGRVVELFPHSIIAERPMRAYYLKDAHASARAKPLITFMKRRFADFLPSGDPDETSRRMLA